MKKPQNKRTAAPPPPRRPAPPPPKPAQKTGTAVATRAAAKQEVAMPDDFEALADQSTGMGTSGAASDNLIPLVRVLQKLSPQVEEKSPEYVEGAEAGMIWLKGIELINGEDGIVVQPCGFSRWIREWVPRESGGGIVNSWQMEQGESIDQALQRVGREFERKKKKKTSKRESYVTADNENDLVETREFPVRIIMPDGRRLPFVVTMGGSNHSVARGWMVMMRGKRSKSGAVLDSYLSLYRLKLKYAENDEGNWYKYEVEDLGKLPEAQEDGIIEDWKVEAAEGRALANAFASGEKRADEGDLDETDNAESDESVGRGDGGSGDQRVPF